MTTLKDSKNDHDSQLEKLADLIRDIEIAMLTTVMPDGSMRSRPMATQKVDFDGDLWFFTGLDSGKVHEIEDDQHVNVSYSSPDDQRYVSVSGTARLVVDREKIEQLWSPILKAWFPKGKEDPNIALIRVHVTSAEYWDAPNSTMVQLYGMIKSALTGKPPADIGDHARLKL